MSRDLKTVIPGETLAFRLADEKQWTWSLRNILLVTVVVVLLAVMLGLAIGAGVLTVLFFRSTAPLGLGGVAFGLMLAVLTLAISTLAVWLLVKFGSELWIAVRVGPTLVEVSDHTLHPGQTFEVIVAQTGPLRCKLWRIALVAREWTIQWASAPDPMSGQGEILQAYMTTRPVGGIELARENDVVIPAGEVRQEHWTVRVPDDAIPSSWSRERAVHWGVEVQGDVNGWPKFTRSFPVAMIAELVPSV